ncbi:MAG TPA: hypothetical protein VIE41_02445 [Methylomirabilota bacterium]|jgi:hypothetical protein
MLNERLFLSFHHVMYSLRGGFLVRPLIIALGSAGALFSALEEAVPALSTWAPKVLFPSHADPQVAQVILAAIATSGACPRSETRNCVGPSTSARPGPSSRTSSSASCRSSISR